MVPLAKTTNRWLRSKDDGPHRSIALSHALHHNRPGLWGDVSDYPTSLMWLRDGDNGGWEVFAAGVPRPALGWLSRRAEGRPIALLAPPSWESSVRSIGGKVVIEVIQTWQGFQVSEELSSKIEVRRLTLEDGPAFEAVAPSWALRSWGKFHRLIDRGLACGIPTLDGFASLAWTYESDQTHDKIGLATVPRFQRLGLARKVASTLLDQIVTDRRRLPVWATTPTNTASIALARLLGFSKSIDETLIRWTPRRG